MIRRHNISVFFVLTLTGLKILTCSLSNNTTHAQSQPSSDSPETFVSTTESSISANLEKDSNDPIVNLPSLGSVKGRRVTTKRGTVGLVYLGIPFAEPPIGELRFEKPAPKKPWQKHGNDTSVPLLCQEYKPACPQKRSWSTQHPYQSEDCLNLNVFRSPRCGQNGKMCPVLYYIHGGMNDFDAPLDFPVDFLVDNYAPRDVILVTSSYRLGIFGFWSTGTTEAPGNYAIYDIILGLKWVNDHIQFFGGNGRAISIMGHSSGGSIASLLTLIPATAGLFQQAITLSGSAFMSKNTVNGDTERYQRAAEMAGCSNITSTRPIPGMLACMKQTATEALLNAYAPQPGSQNATKPVMIPSAMRLDGIDGLIPKPVPILARHRRPIPLLTGTSIREIYSQVDNTPEGLKAACLTAASRYGFFENPEVVAKECFIHFHQKLSNVSSFAWANLGREIIDQASMFIPAYLDARSMAQTGAPVFLYEFEYSKPGFEDTTPEHTFHATFIIGIHLSRYNWTAADQKIRDIYVDLICNFAKFGTPTPSQADFWNVSKDSELGNVSSATIYPNWEAVSPERHFENCYAINLPGPQMKRGYHKEAVEFWAEKAYAIDAAASKSGKNDSDLNSLYKSPWFFAFLFTAFVVVVLASYLIVNCVARQRDQFSYSRRRKRIGLRRSSTHGSSISELSAIIYNPPNYQSTLSRQNGHKR